ncbi:hypothetical protein KAR91_23070, partial [Candidatus Pacearchaeota archaeon]|nr:hypothetical protein [Candidatus Pacearchaeota archaeon]
YGMSTDGERDHMGIHVSTKGNSLVMQSTDGHRLMRITETITQEGLPEINEIISAETVEMVLKLFTKRSAIEADFKEESLVVNGRKYPLILINGVFPNADSVIPNNTSETVPNGFGLDLEYASDFDKSLKALGKPRAQVIMLFGDKKSMPLKIEASHDDMEYLGVLMPVRV